MIGTIRTLPRAHARARGTASALGRSALAARGSARAHGGRQSVPAPRSHSHTPLTAATPHTSSSPYLRYKSIHPSALTLRGRTAPWTRHRRFVGSRQADKQCTCTCTCTARRGKDPHPSVYGGQWRKNGSSEKPWMGLPRNAAPVGANLGLESWNRLFCHVSD